MLREYSRQINQRLPELLSTFSYLEDPRKRKDYGLEEILMGGVGMFLFKQGSRNNINNTRMEKPFVANYEHCLGIRLPHQDMVPMSFVKWIRINWSRPKWI